MMVGLRVQIGPGVGRTEEARTTVPVNPFTGAIVMVELPHTPPQRAVCPRAGMDTRVGLAVRPKS